MTKARVFESKIEFAARHFACCKF